MLDSILTDDEGTWDKENYLQKHMENTMDWTWDQRKILGEMEKIKNYFYVESERVGWTLYDT